MVRAKFKKNPELVKANEVALKTGYNFAETTEVFTTHYRVKKAVIAPGRYRKITGNEATAIGFVAAPNWRDGRSSTVRTHHAASDILHELARHKISASRHFKLKTRSRPFAQRSARASPVT